MRTLKQEVLQQKIAKEKLIWEREWRKLRLAVARMVKTESRRSLYKRQLLRSRAEVKARVKQVVLSEPENFVQVDPITGESVAERT